MATAPQFEAFNPAQEAEEAFVRPNLTVIEGTLGEIAIADVEQPRYADDPKNGYLYEARYNEAGQQTGYTIHDPAKNEIRMGYINRDGSVAESTETWVGVDGWVSTPAGSPLIAPWKK